MFTRFWPTLAGLPLALALGLLASPGNAQLRLPDLLLIPNPSCHESDAAPTGARAFTPADEMTISAVPGGATFVRMVSAGNQVVLRAVGAGGPYIISVFAKTASDEPFFSVCRSVAWAPKPSETFVAMAPRLWLGEVWRIEVTTTSSTATGHLRILRAPNSEINPEISTFSEAMNDAFGLLCLDSPPIIAFPKRFAQGFGGRVRLDIDLDPVANGLTAAQQAALTEDVLASVSLWVQGCGNCRVEHLSVVSVNGQTFVRSGLLTWYGKTLGSGALHPPAATLEDSLRDSLEPTIYLEAGVAGADFPRLKELSTYSPVSDAAASFSRLCGLLPGAGANPTLATIRQALCEPARLAHPEVASIRVRFRADGRTFCGTSKDIVACRADNALTEYNTADYSFRISATGGQRIGHGPIELDFLPVLVHEMGHWIGLGHLAEGESIMGPTLTTARCIDIPTVAALMSGGGYDTAAKPSALLFTGRR